MYNSITYGGNNSGGPEERHLPDRKDSSSTTNHPLSGVSGGSGVVLGGAGGTSDSLHNETEDNSNYLDLSNVENNSNLNMDPGRLDNIQINYQSAGEGGQYQQANRKNYSNSNLNSPSKGSTEVYQNQRVDYSFERRGQQQQ